MPERPALIPAAAAVSLSSLLRPDGLGPGALTDLAVGNSKSAAGTIFVKNPGTNGILIIDNNSLASTFYANVSSADYSTAFDQIQLAHGGRLWMAYPSTYTIAASSLTADGTGNELWPDGLVNTPAALTVSSYTLTISSYSSAPTMTSLVIGYAGGLNLGGNTQAPIANVSTITIQNNGLLTHWLNSTTALGEVHKLNLTLSSMTINTGGSINVLGKGYAAANGPGAPLCGNASASYGGYGSGAGSRGGGAAPSGSYSAPVNLGSGGNDIGGGGAVILNVANTLTMNGSIIADGATGAANQAGSGGSVYLTATSLVGNGSISARGAAANFDSGAGGRIAVVASTASFAGTWTAATNTGSGPRLGGAGTIFIKNPGTNGTLIVDNSNFASPRYAGLLPADYTSSFDAVVLSHGGRLKVIYPSTFSITASSPTADGASDELWPDGMVKTPATLTVSSYTLTISSYSTVPSMTSLNLAYGGTFNLGGITQTPVANVSTITILNNGVLTHWANSTTALGEQHKLNLTISSMTISAGGSINVNGMGYTANNGPGKPGGCGTAAGGYGGEGGTPTAGCQGLSYGSYIAPSNIGSGGTNGAGAGAVILNVTNTLTVNGGILANGVANNQAGSGGSIYITAGVLAGTGTISAQGGGPVNTFDSGAGGRIAVIGSTASFSGTLSAAAASGSPTRIGAAGTVFVKNPGTNGILFINNNGNITTRATYLGTATSSGTYTFDSIFMQGSSSMTFVSFSTVTIAGSDVFFDGDFTSTATVNGNLYGGVISNVFTSSLTATWGTSPNVSSQTYTLDASTAPDYSGTLISSVTLNRNATLTTLTGGTTYYLRVRPSGYAIEFGIPNNWAILGSTCTAAVAATTYTWTGVTNTTWTVGTNWSPTGPPTPIDVVIIDTNSANQPIISSPTAIYYIYIATSGVNGSTLTVNYPLTVSSGVIVGAKGVITSSANSTTALGEVYKSSVTANFMTISGKIDVSQKGYSASNGPGKATCGQSGGSYGGQGYSNGGFSCSGLPYGSYSAPVNIGSGGDNFAGGGAVILNITNALTVNGSILAEGRQQHQLWIGCRRQYLYHSRKPGR